MSAVADVVYECLGGARQATHYITTQYVIKATRQHRPRRGARSTTIVVTVGKPNFAERAFIKLAKKAGKKFPMTNMHVKHYRRTR